MSTVGMPSLLERIAGRHATLTARMPDHVAGVVRVIAYVAFVVYAAALIIGGLPTPIRPSVLDRPHEVTRKWLLKRHIHPGKILFSGAGGAWKSDLTCVTVEGLRSDGTLLRLHSTYDGCAPPPFRIYDDAVETAHVRYLVPWRNARPKLVYASKREAHLWQLRRRGAVRHTARYYCESTQIDEELEQVFITLYYRAVHYDEGKHRELTAPLIHYDCVHRRSRPSSSLATTWTEGYGPGVDVESVTREVRG
jgi:hypothetical protein